MSEKVGQAVSPANRKEFYHRRLPHWHPDEALVFVTWRLFGSLPRRRPRAALEGESQETAGQTFHRVDREIDRAAFGPVWLRKAPIASMIVKTLLAGQNERRFYLLRAFVIMPNHIHLVLLPKVQMAVILRWVKGSTARRANQILGRTGQPFWQDESYDHWIRNESELQRIVRYIHRNPVAAGLVSCEADWPWSTAAMAGETACPTELPYPGV